VSRLNSSVKKCVQGVVTLSFILTELGEDGDDIQDSFGMPWEDVDSDSSE
jgi:hypothetical protein